MLAIWDKTLQALKTDQGNYTDVLTQKNVHYYEAVKFKLVLSKSKKIKSLFQMGEGQYFKLNHCICL